jgi:hypothetical protein
VLKWRPGLVILGAALAGWLVVGPAASIAVLASSSGASGTSTAAASPQPSPPGPPRGDPGRGGPRGARPGPAPVPTLAGSVVSVGASGFSLTVAGATYQVAVSSSTAYSLAPDWSTALGTLASGDQVAVRGTVSGQTVSATSVAIHAWGVAGQVTQISGNLATVVEPSGRTATLQFAAAPELTAGRTVQAVGRWTGDTLAVRAWRVVPDRVDGTVTAVGSDSASVATGDGATATVVWSSQTTFQATPGQTANAAEVAVGTHLHAEGTLSGDTLEATLIVVAPRPRPAP